MPPTRRVSAPAGKVHKIDASKNQSSLITPTKLARKQATYGRATSAKKTSLAQVWGWEKIIDEELARAEGEKTFPWGNSELDDGEKMRKSIKRSNESTSNSIHNQFKKEKYSKRKTITDKDTETDQDQAAAEPATPREKKNGRRKTAGDKPSTEFQIHARYHTKKSSRSLSASKKNQNNKIKDNSQDERLSYKSLDFSQSRQLLQPQSCNQAQPKFTKTPELSSQLVSKESLDVAILPHTPKAGSIHSLEIPSSQSPATPLSIVRRASVDLCTSHKEASRNSISPLILQKKNDLYSEMSSSVEIMHTYKTDIFPAFEANDSSTPDIDLTIMDSFLSTPSKRSNSMKFFEAPPPEKHARPIMSPLFEKENVQNARQTWGPYLKTEILDTEDESDDEPAAQLETNLNEKSIYGSVDLRREDNEDEALEENINSVSRDFFDFKKNERLVQESADNNVMESYFQGKLGPETQLELIKLAAIERHSEDIDENQQILEKEKPIVTFDPKSLIWTNHEGNFGFQRDNDCIDTQRLSSQYLATMAPRTSQSDIFMSIDSQRVIEILNRTRDHETRRYKLPPSICRAWLYERPPISAVRYMAEIGSAKHPGDIIDETGVGNQAFNARKSNTFLTAYEILQLYELENPLTLEELKAKEWLKTAPKPMKWTKIPPAVVDELMANTKSPLFPSSGYPPSLSCSIEVDQGEEFDVSNLSRKPIVSESSIFPIPCPLIHNDEIEVKKESSQNPSQPRSCSPFSQATTVDLTQVQTPRHQSIEIVCETPTHTDLASVLPRLSSPQSGRFSPNSNGDIQAPFSLCSSQLLSKSLLEPDSLLNDFVLLPPPVIPSSEDSVFN